MNGRLNIAKQKRIPDAINMRSCVNTPFFEINFSKLLMFLFSLLFNLIAFLSSKYNQFNKKSQQDFFAVYNFEIIKKTNFVIYYFCLI